MDNSCIGVIEKRFTSKVPQSYIVDVHTAAEMNEIIEHFSVGKTLIIPASNYCKADELPRLDNLYDEISKESRNIIVTELASFEKFKGEEELKAQLSNILGLRTTGNVVVLTFCCEELLNFSDPRIKQRVFISDRKSQKLPQIVFIDSSLELPEHADMYVGVNSIAKVVETKNCKEIYVYTKKNNESYPFSLYSIKKLAGAYDIICQIDCSTYNYPASLGTEKEWSYALTLFNGKSTWGEVISSVLGSIYNLEYILSKYESFDECEKWLYFIALKIFRANTNDYLNMVIEQSKNIDNFVHQLFQHLLSVDITNDKFHKLYSERKEILSYFSKYIDEIEDYCAMSKSRREDRIYYLTDLSSLEKECIFEFLDKYGTKFNPKELESILSTVYPDLSCYLSPFCFKEKWLTEYFQQYKYQKIVNKLLPEFEKMVESQAEKREFALYLEPRTLKFDKIDKSNSQLFFIDAMGVEYLGYILSKCYQKDLEANVTVCYSELPSLTCFNKEFVNTYEDMGLPVTSVKEIDEIKHRGKYNYDYRQTHLPIHLEKELFVLDETIDKIKTRLIKGECKKVIMAADHGASRLAVISNKENKWEMAAKGEHSGRCCPKTDIDEKPSCSIEERGYWILSNYDRFKGSRKSNVEVHGGATLEEVVVPIIEISIKNTDIDIHIVDPVITVSFRKKASITLFSKIKLNNVSVTVNEKSYEAISRDDNFYTVDMPDIKKKGEYTANVYSSGNLLVPNLSFTVEKEGTHENKLF